MIAPKQTSGRRRVALYDAVETSRGPRSRRKPARIEYQGEDDLFPVLKRALGISATREAMRNYAMHRAHIAQLRANVVGPLGKLLVLTGDDWGKRAQDWFNSEWAESAEFFAGLHWAEWLQLAVSAVANEGDFVALFDDGTVTGAGGTGKLVTWEADQIANLKEAAFRAKFPISWRQVNGVIFDEYGRECGVIVGAERGVAEHDPLRALILRADPETPRRERYWIHVKRHWRFRQGRGIAPALSSVALAMDAYEILAHELQSAKVNAALAAIVKREAGLDMLTDEDVAPTDPAAADPAAQSQAEPDVSGALAAAESEEGQNYEQIEALTGGLTEYIDPKDSIEFPNINRPNRDLPAFLDYVTDMSAAPFGLGHAYARMRADSSYTSFRGDLVMTWVLFRDNQKWLERHVCDWAAVRALRWAQQTGRLPKGPDGWERRIAWQWPRMPEVDEAAYQRGVAEALKNGLTTFQQLLGPAWREHMAQLAEEINTARALGLPLSIFETKAGAPANAKPNNGGSET